MYINKFKSPSGFSMAAILNTAKQAGYIRLSTVRPLFRSRMIGLVLAMLCCCGYSFGQKKAKEYSIISDQPIIISVIDLDKSEAYYEKVFGAEVRSIPEDLRQVRRFLKLENGVYIILKAGRVQLIDPDALDRPHIRVTVPANLLEKYQAYLAGEKIKTKEKSNNGAGKPKRKFINDLDGYVIELLPR
ncbi:VOC family protein [Dyadobacter sp. BHUBP1]|uniref:VOC family protein n=1 Tax=Dyadobacter sp. BHUBP1 TaxID=3424178 RepID=UPI003D358E36